MSLNSTSQQPTRSPALPSRSPRPEDLVEAVGCLNEGLPVPRRYLIALLRLCVDRLEVAQ